MKKTTKLGIILSFLVVSQQAHAYGLGTSSYPLTVGKKLLSAEFLGITSTGGGVGFQARYSAKVSSSFLFEGGMGISGGNRSSRIFLGGDWEIYPDYGRQPRFALQGRLINAKEFGVRRNKVSISPSLGKGMSLGRQIFYPYVALPFSLDLVGNNSTYETSLNANLGVVGNLPFRRYQNWIGSIEATVGVKDSFVGFVAGLSWPID